ncbi:hypothetical protein [Amycolatopsis jejuensis]|uniref:hypothetical protein n=1 Tax=Amycolatopsis jejuensis TaxID=330084 RepID=UPI000526CF87|nr:hypothetical protein [Amycolatopsis jejuensis]
MRTGVPAVMAVSATVLTLALTGCSSEKDGTAAPTGFPAPAPAATSAPSSSAPAEGGSSSPGEYTKQGSTLKIGEKAVVPFKSKTNTGAIGVTVTGIEKGAEADLASLNLGDRAKGMTPYYVRVKVTNESGTDFSYSSLGLMNGLLGDGSRAQRVTVIGKFAKCDSDHADKTFTTKGASYDSCVLALAPSGAEVTGANYSASTYRDLAPNTDYGDDALVWKA